MPRRTIFEGKATLKIFVGKWYVKKIFEPDENHTAVFDTGIIKKTMVKIVDIREEIKMIFDRGEEAKKIGMEARKDIETFIGRRFFLELFIR